jgi:tetratricopeptide (TPR) repeat protein
MSGRWTKKSKVLRLLLALVIALGLAAYVPHYLGAQEPPSPEEPVAPPEEPAQPAPEEPAEEPKEPEKEPEPEKPLPMGEAAKIEHEARGFEARGLYAQAVETYKKAFAKAVELAGAAEDEEAEKYWAEAEIYMLRADSLMYQKPKPDYRAVRDFLVKIAQDHKLTPVIDGWRKWELMDAYLRTGELDKLKQTSAELGFITRWMIIGPFQNERGGSFDEPYGPETELQLDAAYSGKKRKVSWRMLPVQPLYGTVDFDAMMRPNDEVLAYALAFIEVSEATEAALRLGSDEGLKVWVNDIEVLKRDIHRYMGFDQDVVGVKLKAGANKILVKLAERNGNWGFRLRVTAPDGGKLEFKQLATRDEFEKASYEAATEKAEVEAVSGAAGYYKKRVEEKPNDVVAQAHWGYLHLVRGFDDENEYKDRIALEKCTKLAPDNPYYRFMLAEAYENMRVTMETEKESNNARLAMEKAIELKPEYVEALYHQTRYYLNEMSNWHKAEGYLKRALKANPDYLQSLLLNIDILSRRGFSTEVKLETLKLGKHPKEEIRTSPTVLRRLMSYYDGADKVEKRLETYKELLRQNYAANSARNGIIGYLVARSRFDEALEIYNLMAEMNPYETYYFSSRADIFVGMDKFSEAISEIDKALEICPEAEGYLIKKGELLMRLSLEEGEDKKTGEIYARGLAVLIEAKRINPNNVWLKRYLEFIQEKEKSYEEHERLAAKLEVKPDDGLYLKYKKLVVAEDGTEKLEDVVVHWTNKELKEQAEKENLPLICLLSKTVTNVRKDGTSSEFYHFVLKIFNEQGTRQFAWGFPTRAFVGWRQDIRIKKARVVHEDGTEEEAKASRWGGVQFPPLKIGDTIDMQFRVDDQFTDLSERFFGDYYGKHHIFHNSYYFGGLGPIKLSEFYLMLPKDRKFYFNYISTEVKPEKQPGLDDKTEIYTWKMTDLPHIVPEMLMPPFTQFLPGIEISTFGDWKEFGKWFYNLIKKQYDSSAEMKKKVKELIAGKETEFEKIRAIYNFVVTDVRYEAWTYGIHGWQPYKASTIFKRKHGDCKDKSLLINTMLKEAGIKSLPVLIFAVGGMQARGTPDMALPMIRHFNHCIAYAPPSEERKEGIWMDGTAEFCGITDGPPWSDWGAITMVVDEDGGQLLTVPVPDPKENVQSENIVVEVAKDLSAKAKFKLTVQGYNAIIVRAQFAREGRRHLQLEEMYGSVFGGAKVDAEKLNFPDLKDLNVESLTYGYEVEIPTFVKKTPEGLALEHEFFAVSWSVLTPEAERRYKVALPYWLAPVPVAPELPGTLQKEMTFVLPKGFEVVTLPKDTKFNSDFADFTLVFEKEKGEQSKVFVKKTLTYKKNNLSIKQYAKLRELTNLLTKALKEKVIIKGPEQPEQPKKEEEKEAPPGKEGEVPPEKPGK